MNQNQPRTISLILIAVVLVCGGSIATAVFVYNQLKVNTVAAPALITPEQEASEQGLLVTGVVPDSMAAQAGLRRGDILLQAGETVLESTRTLQQLVWTLDAGDAIQFTVLRGGETAVIPVTLADALPRLGIELLDPGLPTEFTADTVPTVNDGKPTIARVVPDTPAATAELAAGDIIAVVNDQVVFTSEDLLTVMADKRPGDTLTFMLRRGEETLIRSITLGTHPDDPEKGYLGIELGP
ncbi:MAG: PDZ domain-containing protein [Anaerolineales bacterium]|nr:PDZ domain-containing protein [Anaerolineales bacterium]MCB8965501.1 PDZ domain-containing protein [Ardenticatenaceae bacterium]